MSPPSPDSDSLDRVRQGPESLLAVLIEAKYYNDLKYSTVQYSTSLVLHRQAFFARALRLRLIEQHLAPLSIFHLLYCTFHLPRCVPNTYSPKAQRKETTTPPVTRWPAVPAAVARPRPLLPPHHLHSRLRSMATLTAVAMLTIPRSIAMLPAVTKRKTSIARPQRSSQMPRKVTAALIQPKERRETATAALLYLSTPNLEMSPAVARASHLPVVIQLASTVLPCANVSKASLLLKVSPFHAATL
jgi:hypothetical protein